MLTVSFPARVLTLGDRTTPRGLSQGLSPVATAPGEICGFFTLLGEGSDMSEATKVVLGTIGVAVFLSILVIANLALL